MKNPFETLGISKSIIRELKDKKDSLRSLVEGTYRVLAVTFHPDRGGNRRLMQEINQAYTYLKDDQILESEKERYIKGYAQSNDEKLRRLENTHKELLENLASCLHNSDNPKNTAIQVYFNRNMEIIEFDSYGKSNYSNFENLKVLGSVSKDSLEKIFEYKSDASNPLILPGKSAKDGISVKIMPKDKFMEVLPFVSPELKEGNYLVIFDGNFYRLEGEIAKICKAKGESNLMPFGDIGIFVSALEACDKAELAKIGDKYLEKNNLDLALLAYIKSGDKEKLECFGEKTREKNPNYAAMAYHWASNKEKILEIVDFASKEKKDYGLASSLCDLIGDKEKKGDVKVLEGDLRGAYDIFERMLSSRDQTSGKEITLRKIYSIIDLLIEKGDLEYAFEAANRLRARGKLKEIIGIARKKGETELAVKVGGNKYVAAHRELGDMYLKSGELENAFNEYTIAKNSNKGNITKKDFVAIANKALEKKDYDLALRCFYRDKYNSKVKEKIDGIGMIKFNDGNLNEAFNIFSKTCNKKGLDLVWQGALEQNNLGLMERSYRFLADIDGKTGKRVKRNKWKKKGRSYFMEGGFVTSAFKEYIKRKGIDNIVNVAENFEKENKPDLAIRIYETVNRWDKVAQLMPVLMKERGANKEWYYVKTFQALENEKNSGKKVNDKIRELGEIAFKEKVLSVALNSFEALKNKDGIERVFYGAMEGKNKKLALEAAKLTKDPEKIGDAYLLDINQLSHIRNAVKMYKTAKANEKLEKATKILVKKEKEIKETDKRVEEDSQQKVQ
jgi:curved DNA-binding protein CbpA